MHITSIQEKQSGILKYGKFILIWQHLHSLSCVLYGLKWLQKCYPVCTFKEIRISITNKGSAKTPKNY